MQKFIGRRKTWKERIWKKRYHNMSEEKKERLKNIKTITVRLKSLNLINKIVLIVHAMIYAD